MNRKWEDLQKDIGKKHATYEKKRVTRGLKSSIGIFEAKLAGLPITKILPQQSDIWSKWE